MIWQDVCFLVGNLILSAGLIPTIRDTQKPPLTTTLTVLAVLSSFAVAEWTIDLPLAAFATLAQMGAWVVLGVQRWRQPGAFPY